MSRGVILTGNVNGYTNSINRCFNMVGKHQEAFIRAMTISKLNLDNIKNDSIRHTELSKIANEINKGYCREDNQLKLIVGGSNPTCYSYATLVASVIAYLGGNPELAIGVDNVTEEPETKLLRDYASHVWCEYEGEKLDYTRAPSNKSDYFAKRLIMMDGTKVNLV